MSLLAPSFETRQLLFTPETLQQLLFSALSRWLLPGALAGASSKKLLTSCRAPGSPPAPAWGVVLFSPSPRLGGLGSAGERSDSVLSGIFPSLNNVMQINGTLESPGLGFAHSLQAREAAQRQVPSTSFRGYFQSSHKGPESPATSSVVQRKQGAISRDDSCGGLQPFRPPSPSPLMTAGLEWVGSYFWGHGEGSEVIRDESRLAGGSAVTTAGKSALLRQDASVQQECSGTLFFLRGVSIYLLLSAVIL